MRRLKEKWLCGQDQNGFALPVSEDKQSIADGLAVYLVQHPSSKGICKVALDENRQPNTGDLLRAAQATIMIQIRLGEAK